MDLSGRWRCGFAQVRVGTVLISRWSKRRRADARFVKVVADLQAIGPGGTLRNALRTALGDPGLDVVYLRVGSGGWIDERGQEMTAPVDTDGRAVTPIARDGMSIAALVHDPALLRAPDRLRAAVDAAALAFDNERLRADLRAEVAELRASRARILEAVDVERGRTERNLHDGAQQRLIGTALLLQLAGRRPGIGPEVSAVLAEAGAHLDAAIAELRDLARGLHPAVVAASGLAGALELLAERPGVPVDLRVDVPVPLPVPVELGAYYVVAEALANAAKHAGASLATVRATASAAGLEVSVADDGRGGAAPSRGSGLQGLADRVAALDGRLDVDSAEGRGTTVSAWFPLAGAPGAVRDRHSLAALRWVGWEMFKLPAEMYDQLTDEDQRTWVRGMFATAGGVSRITPTERRWAVGFEAAGGAAAWVLDDLLTHDTDEPIEQIMALPGIGAGGRGLLYTTLRMCTADGDLTPDELERINRTADRLGLPRTVVDDLRRLVDEERALQDRRFEMIVAPAVTDGPR